MYMQEVSTTANKGGPSPTFARAPALRRPADAVADHRDAAEPAGAISSSLGHRFDQVAVRAPAIRPLGASAERAPVIQAKLTISRPGDPYEQEADRMAETVLRMPEPRAAGGQQPWQASSAQTLIGQRTASIGPVVQRDAIDDAREKLSYGLFDWAITDAEALDVLAMLGTIAPANLPAALTRLGSKYVTRLLDNLPDAAKTGDVYKRLIEALGVQGVLPYTEGLLSYGVFDWAITDADVTRVFNTFITLPAAAQEQFLGDLNAAGRLGRLIDNSTTGHHALYIRPWIATLTPGALTPRQRQILRTIVENTSDDAMDTLKLATQTRFNVTVGPATIPGYPPVNWQPGSLRRSYLILDTLPEAHIAGNRDLIKFGQFQQPAVNNLLTGGVYWSGTQELIVNTEASDVEENIIHETGHAVDRVLGWTTGPEPAKSARGGWLSYGVNHNTAANDMVFDSNGAIRTLLTLPQRLDVVSEMATAMGNRSAQNLENRIKARPWYAGLASATKDAVVDDRALTALRIGLNKPYFNATDGGEHLGTHVYQESYAPSWVRYEHAARARKVSDYQFRDPGEWFAEAYAYYYLPDSRGKGAKLNDKDPNTKTYFDNTVDKIAPTR
jgi:hypothetical protein